MSSISYRPLSLDGNDEELGEEIIDFLSLFLIINFSSVCEIAAY